MEWLSDDKLLLFSVSTRGRTSFIEHDFESIVFFTDKNIVFGAKN